MSFPYLLTSHQTVLPVSAYDLLQTQYSSRFLPVYQVLSFPVLHGQPSRYILTQNHPLYVLPFRLLLQADSEKVLPAYLSHRHNPDSSHVFDPHQSSHISSSGLSSFTAPYRLLSCPQAPSISEPLSLLIVTFIPFFSSLF